MDIPGEKLVIKLWETLTEKGIGGLLSPWQQGREGLARLEIRRREILMLAQAETDAAEIRAGRKQLHQDGTLLLVNDGSNPPHADGRIEPTVDFSTALDFGQRSAAAATARSEINAAKAILCAEEQLSADPQPPPETHVDEDWLFAWREHAGKTSTEDLQRLWGSVLAGEVKSPGKYSIRTLEFLKTLSKAEAEQISLAARFVVSGSIVRSQEEHLAANGLEFSTLLNLQELGVLAGVESIGLTRTYRTVELNSFRCFLVSHDKALIVSHSDASKVFEMKVYILTAVGMQVLGLGSFESDPEYLQSIGKEVAAQGFTVHMVDWQAISDGRFQYSNPQQVQDQPRVST